MKGLKRCVVMVILALFACSPALSLAADKQFFIIKDKKGRCYVKEMEKKSPKTIAGPYTTKDEAEKAKDKECAKAEDKKPTDDKKPTGPEKKPSGPDKK
jgi:hypothetical protein